MHAIKAVLFDLDGTLLDTARDLANALNTQLARHQQPSLPFEQLRQLSSQGSVGLLEHAFKLKPGDTEFTTYREEYLDCYEQVLAQDTCLFPGMEKVLSCIEQRGLRWGIVTNKPKRFAIPLLQQLQLTARSATTVCGDTTARAKPDPLPLLVACEQLALEPRECLYIGDAKTDSEACTAIKMPILIATYGYIRHHEDPYSWPAQGYIKQATDIIDYLHLP